MAVDHWERVQELFKEVRARPAEERTAFLTEACGGDVELRAEVEALLEHHERAPADFLQPAEPDPFIGGAVGGYHIKGLIASGGMGTVYEAVQEQPRRTVALKVMKRNVASRSALRRFQFESQILGRLRHRYVAQVHAAGMHGDGSGGVPYFAMEYIPGAKAITRYAEEKTLGLRARLRLFANACEGVHHGHQKGIIHRDLKPANILVDSGGEPKIIDFGVARATDSDLALTTEQTHIGQLIGTMQYMSPEQCDADPHDLDTRSDVYSLGIVLYELLTGELPYDASSTTIYRATTIIKESEPRKPSSINPKLRGDVETIVLKALKKDRDQRYQSAADLAQDIHRYLNHEPIEARPPTVWTRAVHWALRHPVVTTGASCCAISAIIAVATIVFVQLYNFRPAAIEVSPNLDEVRLLSYAGSRLHSWTAKDPCRIRFADLTARPEEYGAGRLVLVGYNAASNCDYPCLLCAFDAARYLDEPVWKRRIETRDIPPRTIADRGFTAEQFGVGCGKVVDVFPQLPGDEIVAVHQHAHRSHSAIRVYDQKGEILYQVWHDGRVEVPYWLSDAGLLVFVGRNSAVLWDDRGYPDVVDPDPIVIFALRPRLAFIAADYIPSMSGDGPLDPVWYRCLLPPEALEFQVGYNLSAPLAKNDPGQSVHVTFNVTGSPAAVSWLIDEFGNEIPGTKAPNDHWKRNQGLPDFKVFYLGPLPPIVSGSSDAKEPVRTTNGTH